MKKEEVFKLLSCKSRYDMFKMFLENDEVCTCHFEKDFNLSQANVSKHIRAFRELDMLDCRCDGTYKYYKLTEDFKNNNKELINYIK